MHHVLLITGSMGSGKTTMLGEASDLLVQRKIIHAGVDLDWLAHAPLTTCADLLERNLAGVVANFKAAGIDRLLIAGAIETRAELERIREAVTAPTIVVCRLRAPIDVMQARVATRERGMFAPRYIDRVAGLERLLDEAALEDFTVDTTAASLTSLAIEMLERAGWIEP
jgi:hypothetical protein